MPVAWHIKETCIPADVPSRRPRCWHPFTCKCQKHKGPPTTAVFHAFCSMGPKEDPAAVVNSLRDSTGATLGGIQARILLALPLLIQREPRACLYPYGDAEGIGDALEAILGLCEPHRPRDKTARDQLGALFGLKHFNQLHSELELLITAASRLVT
eukprot:5595748-Pyramimonas_sp.AAC.1